MTPLDAFVLGIVEGITEFLPVSSTGHLIITSWLLGLNKTVAQKSAVDDFEIIIQAGAILAVLGLYRARVMQMLRGVAWRAGARGLVHSPHGGGAEGLDAGWRIARNVVVAFVPSAVVGLTAEKWIKSTLFQPAPVVGALIVGGLIMLAIAPWQSRRMAADREAQARLDAGSGGAGGTGGTGGTGGSSMLRGAGARGAGRAGLLTGARDSLARMTMTQAAFIGCMQCAALWPGTSRSFATILGGMLIGLGAVAAAEFSFILGLLTLTAASGYKVMKIVGQGHGEEFLLAIGGWLPLVCGLLTAWASAALAVDLFVKYLGRHTLALFGWWRLAVAGIVLVVAWQFGLTISP